MDDKTFVDFRAVKAAVTMQMALDHYGVNWLRKRGDELRGRCPIHQGEGQNTFHVSLAKGAFHCFSCQARGNVLDFVATMEKCSVRDAALKLKDWFGISSQPAAAPAKGKPAAASRGVEESAAANKPLKFHLKAVDSTHPYLSERGITRATAEVFGVGFFSGK